MARQNYNLHLKGYVGGWDFDADYVDFVLNKHADSEVHVLIDSLGGSLAKALSITAAFRNHGNVHVHYVGMNASAATIASLGAAHVSIDSSAMYLVHKCSMEFFQWASANSDKLQSIIDEASQMKEDLDKMDMNVAQMYAAKCKRKCEDLLVLMQKGGWLTAAEALEWGFVDEITSFEEDAAPVIDDKIAADMGAAGIPVPSSVAFSAPAAGEPSQSFITRFVEALTGFFKNNSSHNSLTNTNSSAMTENPTPEAEAQQPAAPASPETPPAETVTLEAHNEALAQRDKTIAEMKTSIADLKAQLEAMKKAPGAETSHVVGGTSKTEPDENSAEAFCNTYNRAKDLYNLVP